MKRLLLGLIPLVLVLSACAVSDPKPTTYISDRGATLNGDVYSSVVGDTSYWWRYGETTSYGSQTPIHNVAIDDDQPHPVSEPISGLTADTTYHFRLCVQDTEEDPPRTVCSSDRTFTTGPTGGRSGIAFASSRGFDIWAMDADGAGQGNLTDSPSVEENNPAWSPDGTKIAFDRGGEIYAMGANGSTSANLTNTPTTSEFFPAWSPDGSKIAYEGFAGTSIAVYVMDADGSNQVQLPDTESFDGLPEWSPDGRKIAFLSDRDAHNAIYTMDPDGSNQTRVTDDSFNGNLFDWSPDGTEFAFSSQQDGGGVFVMGSDGSNVTQVAGDADYLAHPTWSPDGTKIAFTTFRDGNDEIYSINADGGSPTNRTNDMASDSKAAWSPRP